jgi:ADP-ribose pyrophosphatase YjhB (NUDIX family)
MTPDLLPPRPTPPIAVKAICLLPDPEGTRLFVIRCYDPGDNTTFYKPPGGSVDFGERAREAIVREVREELDAALDNLQQLGVLEFFASFDRRPLHEITFVFGAGFADPRFYALPAVTIYDHNLDGEGFDELTALWMPIARFRAGDEHLGPEGVLDLLDAWLAARDPQSS